MHILPITLTLARCAEWGLAVPSWYSLLLILASWVQWAQTESGLFVGRAAAQVLGFPAQPHLNSPLIKQTPCGTHTAAPSHCLILHALHFPKRQTVFVGQGWPQPSGASESHRSQNFPPGLSQLALQPWTCCSLCVCSPSLPDSIYPPQALLIRVKGSLCRTGALTPGEAGATKLHFLSSALSCASGTSYRVFPFQLVKPLPGHCKASSALLGFKIPHQLRLH